MIPSKSLHFLKKTVVLQGIFSFYEHVLSNERIIMNFLELDKIYVYIIIKEETE